MLPGGAIDNPRGHASFTHTTGDTDMKKRAVFLGLILLLAMGPLTAKGESQNGQAAITSDEIGDASSEHACDCCQKCNAARRSKTGREGSRDEEGISHENGCQDCCERCGKRIPPAPDQTPPEVIEKEIPPKVKDKPRR